MVGKNYNNKFTWQFSFLSMPYLEKFVFLTICRQIVLLLRS